METMEANIIWQQGMAFKAHLDGFELTIDAGRDVGGSGRGPKPKGLTLVSLAGCTGMDVIAILKKMRIKPDYFEVRTDAVLADEHPRVIREIVVKYIFRGTDLPADKIKKAVNLSEERYCGVSATLKPTVKLRSQILLNDQTVT